MFEWQWLLLVLVVAAIYFPRLTTLTIRGEESRRARVAVEILESGDWIVPRQQGQIYLSRPPLGSYPIALLGMLRGKVDLLATRLPTATAVLLTSLLVYFYARTLLSADGALAAALAFATMGQVMEIGRLAETEATFTLLVASSLLLWHWGYTRHWPGWAMWSVGYAFAALAGLTKGPQGPVYFGAVAVVYLIFRKDWHTLFSTGHAVGLVTFAVVLGAWQVPYYLSTDLESSVGIWMDNAAQRFEENTDTSTMLAHMVRYPLEVLVCMLPWSLLLLRYGDRRLRAALGPAREHAGFLWTAIVVTFPSVWLASTAKGRYYMPLFPCFAVLVGIVIDRCLAAATGSHLRRVWQHYCWLLAAGFTVAAITVAVASWCPIDKLAPLAQPALFAGGYLVIVLMMAGIVWKTTSRAPAAGMIGLAVMLGLSTTGVVINAYARAANDATPAVAELKQTLPAGIELTSFGRVDHLFAYLYETPIAYHPLPETADEVDTDVDYFVLDGGPKPVATLPFAWEEVATIALDRNRMDKPRRTVIIGRRVPAVADQHIRPATARQ